MQFTAAGSVHVNITFCLLLLAYGFIPSPERDKLRGITSRSLHKLTLSSHSAVERSGQILHH